jgi:hypothetical protein
VQAAQHRFCDDRDAGPLLPAGNGNGNALRDSLMWSSSVEERDVFAKDPVKMPLAYDDEMVQALASKPADESLARGVHAWRSGRCLDDPNSHALRRSVEGETELVVTVSD